MQERFSLHVQWVPYNPVLPDAHNVCRILINTLKDTCKVIITCMYYRVIINDVSGSSWLLSSIRTYFTSVCAHGYPSVWMMACLAWQLSFRPGLLHALAPGSPPNAFTAWN